MKNIFDFKFEKYKLANGMEIVLYKDNSIPIAAVNLWYKVGSANEKPGKTGFAHLFEHMMFQGSENVPKEMHFKHIQEAGGNLNGSTSFDRTNYYETVPANNLELALWLESDRMGYLLPSLTQEKLENQKEVVMNERRERYENQPYGRAWELIFSNLYDENHPYSWPTIGWMNDIKNFQLDDIKSFFKTYYAPNNASLVISGDINIDETKKMIDAYFGSLNSVDSIPPIIFEETQLSNTKSITHEDDVQLPRIYFAWDTEKAYSKDDAVIDLLTEILSGSKNSRLYKKLVFEKQIVQDISCFQISSKLTGTLLFVATARPSVSLEEIKSEIFNELKNIAINGIEQEEMIRAKNSFKSAYIYALQNLGSLTDQINNYNCYLGEPNSFMFDLNRYESANPIDIVQAVEQIINKPYVELKIIPKNSK